MWDGIHNKKISDFTGEVGHWYGTMWFDVHITFVSSNKLLEKIKILGKLSEQKFNKW